MQQDVKSAEQLRNLQEQYSYPGGIALGEKSFIGWSYDIHGNMLKVTLQEGRPMQYEETSKGECMDSDFPL